MAVCVWHPLIILLPSDWTRLFRPSGICLLPFSPCFQDKETIYCDGLYVIVWLMFHNIVSV